MNDQEAHEFYKDPEHLRIAGPGRRLNRVTKKHRLPSCGDPDCHGWRHRVLGWFMRKRPYPWQEQ
jgi:hypothetical protein